MYGGERNANGIELGLVRLAQKFQRDVHSFRAYPASPGAFRFETRHQLAKRAANGVRNVERDEKAHDSRASVRGKQKVASDGVQRLLGGLKADALAVAGEARGAFAAAAFVGDADVHEADGFFRRSATRAGDSGDADAERRAGGVANAVGEGQGSVGTDRAFRVDNVGGNADER